MSYLLDTNILLRIVDSNHPMNADAVEAIDSLRTSDTPLFIATQNLIELWNVCTRPLEKNGLGLTLTRTKTEVEKFKNLFVLLPDTSEIYEEWERLATRYEVRGVNVHDTRLVALMLIHRVSHILTFNVKDFRRFDAEVTPVSPREIVESKYS